MGTDLRAVDIVRVMNVTYGTAAMVLNAHNLWRARQGGYYSKVSSAARVSIVLAGFSFYGIIEMFTRLGGPLSWRLPFLFACYSLYFWSQLLIQAQIRKAQFDAIRAEALHSRHPFDGEA